MNFLIKRHIYPVAFGILLTLFTVLVILDTFVIEKRFDPIRQLPPFTENTSETCEQPSEETSPGSEIIEPTVTENYYLDENIEITISQHRAYDSDIYVADVKLSKADYLKTALADNSYGKNIVDETSNIAKANNAIFAVNGDFYGSQEKGYVLKNGILYRNEPMKKQEDLVIYPDGSFEIILETEVSAESLYENGAYQILAFGPALIENGKATGSTNAPRGAIKKNNPRTAIGMIDELHYVFVVCDGRTDESKGMTVFELAEFMLELGAVTAYNLDGGGSATMYFNGKVVNTPTFNGKDIKERNVSDIVYIGY